MSIGKYYKHEQAIHGLVKYKSNINELALIKASHKKKNHVSITNHLTQKKTLADPMHI